MFPLYKKGDYTDFSNYQPITALNIDYRIMMRVLAIRLGHAVPATIH